MSTKRDRATSNSTTVVGPYARIRVILAIILFVIAIIVIGYRAITG